MTVCVVKHGHLVSDSSIHDTVKPKQTIAQMLGALWGTGEWRHGTAWLPPLGDVDERHCSVSVGIAAQWTGGVTGIVAP